MTNPGKASSGPWRWGWYDDTSLIEEDALCNDNGGKLGVYSDPVALSAGNAALIASAPTMAEMLRELEWAGCDCSPYGGGSDEACRCAMPLSRRSWATRGQDVDSITRTAASPPSSPLFRRRE